MNEENLHEQDETIRKNITELQEEIINDIIEENQNNPEILDKIEETKKEIKPPETINRIEIKNLTRSVLNFIKTNERLPNYLETHNNLITIPEYLYLLTNLIQDYFTEKEEFSLIYGIKDPQKPHGIDILEMKLSIKELQKDNTEIIDYIKRSTQAPENAIIDGEIIQYQDIVYIYSYLIAYSNGENGLKLDSKKSYFYNPKIKEHLPKFDGYKNKNILAKIYNKLFLIK